MYCRTVKVPFVGKPTSLDVSKAESEERARFFATYPMPIWCIMDSEGKVMREGDMYYIFVHIYFCYKESAM